MHLKYSSIYSPEDLSFIIIQLQIFYNFYDCSLINESFGIMMIPKQREFQVSFHFSLKNIQVFLEIFEALFIVQCIVDFDQ